MSARLPKSGDRCNRCKEVFKKGECVRVEGGVFVHWNCIEKPLVCPHCGKSLTKE